MVHFLRSVYFSYKDYEVWKMLDNVTEIVIFSNLILLLYILIRYCIGKRIRKNYPPGPIGLPFVGYLPFLSNYFHFDFVKLGKKYGDIFSIRLGSKNIVILQTPDAIKEAFSKPEFMGKTPLPIVDCLFQKSPFLPSNFRCWREHRKFLDQIIKELVFSESKLEHMQKEIQRFVEVLRTFEGKPMDLREHMATSVINNASDLLFGTRYLHDKPSRQYLEKVCGVVLKHFVAESPCNFFPWIRHVPFFAKLLKFEDSLKDMFNLQNLIRKAAKKYEQYSDSQNSEHVIGKYLLEIKSKMEKDSSTSFTDENLMYVVRDLFVASTETIIQNFIECIHHVTTHPDIQKKVQEEINAVIGVGRNPHHLDHKNMPYTQAVILESLRLNGISLSLFLLTTENTTVGGYDIPKGTSVFANFWNANNDSRYWTETEVFKPERFLSSDGKSVVNNSNLMRFSSGKRLCPGATMAKLELFLYLTSVLQNFTVEYAENLAAISDDPNTKEHKPEQRLLKFVPNNIS